MNSLRILHSADFHLNSPFEALSGGKAAVRRAEQRRLLDALGELCGKEKADIVLLSGDLLDSRLSFCDTGQELLRALGNIPAPVFIAPGNRDFYAAGTPYASLKLPENVYIFKSREPECIELPGLHARIYGAAFTGEDKAPVLEGFSPRRSPDFYNILCIHGDPSEPGSDLNPVSEAWLAQSGIDFAAFGHNHQASGLKKAGSTWYSWPGCPEGRSFQEAGDKTVSLIELEGDSCGLSTFSIAQRLYESLEVDITDTSPLLAISRALPDDTVSDIYRIILKGRRKDSPNLEELYERLSGMFFELILKDETRLPASVWEQAQERSLRGIFLSRLRRQYKAASGAEDKRITEKAVRLGLAALDRREEAGENEDK